MLHIISHAFTDTLKVVPFLLITYLLIELIEHKASGKTQELIYRSGKFGPVIGGLLGIVPQCGFSAATASFYSGGVITKGTLIAVFLSTSDEMLPIMISSKADPIFIIKVLGVKLLSAVLAGMLVDFIESCKKHGHHMHIHEMCETGNCHCEKGIIRSALHHSLQIALFIFFITVALNAIVHVVGEDNLASFILNKPVIGELLSGIIGLIPNCASSVIITQLYLEGGMSAGAMLSGLLTGSGVGMLVLFRTNKNVRENLRILAITYFSGVILGMLLGLLPIF